MADFFTQYEEDKKKKKPSQVAAGQQKTKTNDFFSSYENKVAKVEIAKPVEAAPEVKKPSFIERAKQKVTDIFSKKKDQGATVQIIGKDGQVKSSTEQVEPIQQPQERINPIISRSKNLFDSMFQMKPMVSPEKKPPVAKTDFASKVAGTVAEKIKGSEFIQGQKAKKEEFFSPDKQSQIFQERMAEVKSVQRPVKEGYKEPGLFGSAVEAIKESTVSTWGSLGATTEMVGRMTNNILTTKAGQKMQKDADKIIASNPEWAEETGAKWSPTKVTRLVVGAVPSLLATVAATFVAGPTGGAAVGFGLEGGSTYKEAKAAGVPEKKAQLYGVVVGTVNSYLEKLFPESVVKGSKPVIKKIGQSLTKDAIDTAARFGVKVTKAGTFEGATESLQQMWSNVIAKNYDENRSVWNGVLESFIGGFGSGGAVGAVSGGNVISPEQLKTQVENTDLAGTQAGDEIAKVVDQATKENKSIKFTTDGTGDTVVTTNAGTKVGLTLVEPQTIVQLDENNNPMGEVNQVETNIIENTDTPKLSVEPVGGIKDISPFKVTGKEILLTPDEYLKQAFEATDGRLGGNYNEWLASNLKKENVSKYAKSMKNGDKFPVPSIDNINGSQDGIHRALAAKEIGLQKIPVTISGKPSDYVSNKRIYPISPSPLGGKVEPVAEALETTVESPKVEDLILPKDVSINEESKKVGAKRISPDRIAHQQLTPEEGKKALVAEQEKIANKNRDSWLKAIDGLNAMIAKYGDILPVRSESNLSKYPELQNDFNKYSSLKSYAHNPKSLVDMRDQFIKNSERVSWNEDKKDKFMAKVEDKYKQLIKDDISHGYKYPEAVLNYDPSFRKAVDSRARYEKGLFTSFSADDQRIVFDEQGRITAGMKRQDGKDLLPEQKSEIIDGVIQTQNALGIDLNQISIDDRWVYAHLNGKNPFLTKNAAGQYRKGNNQVSISLGGTESIKEIVDGKEVSKKINTTVAHELGHALDFKIKNQFIDSSTLFYLRMNFNKVINSTRGDKYWRSSVEVTARAIEEYVAVKEGSDKFYDRPGYWSKEVFESKIKPAIEKTINDKYADYKIKEPIVPKPVESPTIQPAEPTITQGEKPPVDTTATKEEVKPPTIVKKVDQVKIDTANKKLTDYYAQEGEKNPEALGQAWQEVMTEMEIAEPGQRLYTEDGEFNGAISSTFPDFIPEELRLTKLFNSVVEGLKDPTVMTYPPSSQPRKQALYDAILDQIDSRAGTDSSIIREEIRSIYEEARPKEVVSGSPEGSQRTEVTPTKEKVKIDKFISRVFERLQAENPEQLPGEIEYTQMNLKKDAQKAVDLLTINKQKAYRVAMGEESSPDVTSTSVNIAMAERALEEGNNDLYAKLITKRSLDQTRRGQEIVAEKGSVTNNSTARYVKELVAARFEKVGKMLSDISMIGKSTKEKVQKTIDSKVGQLEIKIKKKKLDVKTALQLLESMRCV